MNRKNKLSLLTALGIFVLCSGFFFECNSSGTHTKTGSANYNSFFPVEKGMQWQYVNQAPRDETELFNVEVNATEMSGESLTASLSSFPYFTKMNNAAKLKITKKGEIFVVDSSGTERLFLPEEQKLTKEQTWQYGDWSAYVGDTNIKVNTDSGTSYDCTYINYTLGGFTFSVELWLSKDKGVVKWGSNRTNPPSRSITYYVLK